MKLNKMMGLSAAMLAMLLAACSDKDNQKSTELLMQLDQETETLIANFTRVSDSDPNCKVPDLPYIMINCLYDHTNIGIIKGFYKAVDYDENNEAVRHDLINAKGEVLSDLKTYQEVDWQTSHGLTAVMQNDKIGYIDLTGNLVIPMEYDNIIDPDNKYSEQWAYPAGERGIVVKKGDKYGVIDHNNQVIIPFEFDMLSDLSTEGISIYHQYDGYDEYGMPLLTDWGMVDLTGKQISLSQYDGTPSGYTALDGVQEGLLAVYRDDLWGYVDINGQEVIALQYQDARSFSEGVAGVMYNGLWGFIDKNGNTVIDFQFPDANVPRYSVNMMGGMMFVFHNGKAEVSTNVYEQTACINHQAQMISCE